MYTLILVDYNALESTLAYIQRCFCALPKEGTRHIVIVENGLEGNNVQRLTDQYGAAKIIRVDNVSQTVYSFQADDRQIIYCHSGGNLGYAKGNNLGAVIAKALWADPYYIISNNDLEFDAELRLDTIQELFDAKADIAVIGPKVITTEGVIQSPHKWISAYRRLIVFIWLCSISNFVTPQRYAQIKARYCEDLCPDAVTGPCGWVSGCFFIVRSDAFHKVGMFDPHTFLYAEEPILSRRMEQAGYAVWFCRELEVIHRHAQTTKNAMSRLRIMQQDFESMLYYYKTYTNTKKVLLLLAKWNFTLYKCLHAFWNGIKRARNKNAK